MSVRSWVHYAILDLQAGKEATIKPGGKSMTGKVEDGDTVILVPAKQLAVGDVVLCRVKGKDYLHLIKAQQGDRHQIGNNRGGINGWVGSSAIYGVAISVNGRVIKEFEEESSD